MPKWWEVPLIVAAIVLGAVAITAVPIVVQWLLPPQPQIIIIRQGP